SLPAGSVTFRAPREPRHQELSSAGRAWVWFPKGHERPLSTGDALECGAVERQGRRSGPGKARRGERNFASAKPHTGTPAAAAWKRMRGTQGRGESVWGATPRRPPGWGKDRRRCWYCPGKKTRASSSTTTSR